MTSSRFITAVAGGALTTTLVAAAALAQDVSVTLNGTPVALSPAPITRDGRVFVPLRGVFERLGASVVYADGTINAQGHGHAVSLHIGSTNATVDNQPQQLDVAPFIVGASTYVPLRFVSQALGAQVNYDGANRIVALTNAAAAPNEVIPARPQPPQAPPPAPPQRVVVQPQRPPESDLRLVDVRPGEESTVRASRPEISGRFSVPVDVNSVRIMLDGRDVTGTSYLNPQQFTFTPNYNLPAQRHVVEIAGRTRDGDRFERRFDFTSGAGVAANFVRVERPGSGDTIGTNAFHVRGETLPNSKVRIAASGSLGVGGAVLLRDNYTTDVTANGDGRFEADVPLQDAPGSNVTLQVQSVSPDGQAATAREQLHVR
jgi:hypothetical protein